MKTTYLQKLKSVIDKNQSTIADQSGTNSTNFTNPGIDLSKLILEKRSQLMFEYSSLTADEKSQTLNSYKSLIKQKRSAEPDYKAPAILVLDEVILGAHTHAEFEQTAKYAINKMVTIIPDGLADIDENNPKLKKLVTLVSKLEKQANNRQHNLNLESLIRNALQNMPGTSVLISKNGEKSVSLGAGLAEFGLDDPRVAKIIDFIRKDKAANL